MQKLYNQSVVKALNLKTCPRIFNTYFHYIESQWFISAFSCFVLVLLLFCFFWRGLVCFIDFWGFFCINIFIALCVAKAILLFVSGYFSLQVLELNFTSTASFKFNLIKLNINCHFDFRHHFPIKCMVKMVETMWRCNFIILRADKILPNIWDFAWKSTLDRVSRKKISKEIFYRFADVSINFC